MGSLDERVYERIEELTHKVAFPSMIPRQRASAGLADFRPNYAAYFIPIPRQALPSFHDLATLRPLSTWLARDGVPENKALMNELLNVLCPSWRHKTGLAVLSQ